MQADLTLIVATDRQRGIGINNAMPWRLAEDMAFFKRTTSGHTVIMGRKTFDSIGKPLPNRRNIVVTRNPAWQHEGVETAASLEQALQLAAGELAFIMGGAQIYAESLPLVKRLLVTEIDRVFDCDTFFPPIPKETWRETARQPYHSDANGFDYAFVTYERA